MLFRINKSMAAAAVTFALGAVTLSAPVLADGSAVKHVKGDLSVMVLGSGGPQIQDSGRASAGYLVFADGQPYALMDLGGGTFKSLGMSGAHIGQVNTILLSHMHIDHVSEVPAVIKGIYFDGQLQGAPHTASIQVWGPVGRAAGALYPADPPRHGASPPFPSTSDYMDALFAQDTGNFNYLRTFVGGVDGGPPIIGNFGYTAHDLPSDYSTYDLRVIVDDVKPDGSELKITGVAVNHFEAPAVAYRIDYKGHSIVYTGDIHSTDDIANENIATLAAGADYLIYDTSILDNIPPPASPFARRHTTPANIGLVAAAAGVKTLVLSHLTPVSEPNIHSIIDEIKAQGFTGKIKVARDLRVFNTDD